MDLKYPLIICIVQFVYGFVQGQDKSNAVAYWSFNEKTGKVATDNVTGNKDSIHYIFNKVKPYSDPIRSAGIFEGALVFDGFSTFLQRSKSEFNTPSKSMSISVWVAPRTFEHGAGGKLSAIINQQNIRQKKGFVLGMFRHGRWSFQIGTGDKWIEIWDEGNPIPRESWSYLVATYESQTGKISLYLNGKPVAGKSFSHDPIQPADEPLLIGRHNQPETLGRGNYLYHLNMFNGLMDELKIFDKALSIEEINKTYSTALNNHGGKIPFIPYSQMTISRSVFKQDPYRPQYHATPPGHWMNEPHAPLFYNGKYHLFYQHNPTGPYWAQIHWGHWVSDDLVHWKDMPPALYPENDSVAPDGIWSGSATYDKDGTPVLFYTFGNWSKVLNQGVAIAKPKDKNDPDLVKWVKQPMPTVTQDSGQGLTGEFRDPFVWKDSADKKWYMLVGSGIKNKGGTVWFYVSDDLTNWHSKGSSYLSDYEKYSFLGAIWELPVFLPLGKYPDGEDRYVFLISPKGEGANLEVYYWLGRFDKKNYRFIADNEDPKIFDYGGNKFTGPSGMIDPKTGRALIFSITQGGGGPGWAFNAGLPAHIFLNTNGDLGIKPVEELTSLRKQQLLSVTNKSLSVTNKQLKKVQGDMLEIILEIKSNGANKYGIKVRKSPDGNEEVFIYYDAANKKLVSDGSKTFARNPFFNRNTKNIAVANQGKGSVNSGNFILNNENLKLHIFLDKSQIEVYANDRNSITGRTYPLLTDALGLEVYADGDAVVKTLNVWEMKSIYY